MYSSKKNILQLVSLMKAHHIRYAVLCPGARNAPLVQTLAACPDFTCYSVVDERSAGFFAIGLAQAYQSPVAVCCTSGSALLNIGPAVAEAFYQEIPLLVLSADRPEAWIGQKDGQTFPQPNVFGSLVKKSVQLPQPSDKESKWHCNRLVNEALLALQGDDSDGPVHINIPVSEPFLDFSATELPFQRRIKRLIRGESFPEFMDLWNNSEKVMIVWGQMKPDYEHEILFHELEDRGCVIVSEHLSNVPDTQCNKTGVFYHRDWNLMTAEARRILLEGQPFPLPDLVLCCGGHLVSKSIKKFLRDLPRETIFVQSTVHGELADPFMHATHILEGNMQSILWEIAHKGERKDPSFANAWIPVSEKIHQATEALPASHSSIYRIKEIMELLPPSSALHLANSSTVRLAELAKLNPAIPVFCNRGISGIEGSLSTAAGYAAGSNQTTYLITGDLSYFYDLSILRHAACFPGLRVVLLHNGGGEIFHSLPGMQEASQLDTFITASHHAQTKGWLEDCGIKHYFAGPDHPEPASLIQQFLSDREPRPAVLELRFEAQREHEAYEQFYGQFHRKI